MGRSRRTGFSALGICLLLLLTSWTAAAPQGAKEITLEPKILGQYAGTYELAPNFKIMITLEGNQLMAQASGQSRLPIYPSSETKFFYKVVDAQIEFFKNDKGVVDRLVLHQNGREMPAPRTSDKVSLRTETKVSPAILAKYVGTYELQPGVDNVVTLEGDQLMTQLTGQQKLPLFAESETKFFLRVVDAQVEFIKDQQGAVTHLLLRQGPNEIKARRK